MKDTKSNVWRVCVLHLSQTALLLKSLYISIRFGLHLFKGKERTAEKGTAGAGDVAGTALLFPSAALNKMNLFKQVNFLTETAQTASAH